MTTGKLRRPLFIFCLCLSVLLHIGGLYVVFHGPLTPSLREATVWFKPNKAPEILPVDRADLLVEKAERALEESLNQVIAMGSGRGGEEVAEEEEAARPKQRPILASSAKLQKKDLEFEVIEKAFALTLPPAFDPEEQAALSAYAKDEVDEGPLFDPSIETLSSVDFHGSIAPSSPVEETLVDDFTVASSREGPVELQTEKFPELSVQLTRALKKLKTPADYDQFGDDWGERDLVRVEKTTATTKLILPNSVDYLRKEWLKRSHIEAPLPEIEHYGLKEVASEIVWEEDVQMDIAYQSDPETGRYIFSLTLYPDFTFEGDAMPQNFYFLIDRSSSIERHKFSRFKKSVQRALTTLREQDTFNIIFFDKKIARLAETNLPATERNIQRAEDFLERELPRSLFSAGDIYGSLDSMIPQSLNSEELHSVILISDGNGLLSATKQKQAITNWLNKNKGAINFYTAAAGKGNNLAMMDLLSWATAGHMLYSDTNASFPRKLVRFVKDLQEPLVKNVSVEITPTDSRSKVHLYPEKAPFSPMFASKPYTIVGTIDELCDFTVYLQGRNNNGWLNIRKKISLKDGKKGGRALEKLWMNTKVQSQYEQYLKTGRTTHLKQAKEIASTYRGTIALD